MRPGQRAQAALREERWRHVESRWGMWAADDLAQRTGHHDLHHLIEMLDRDGLTGVRRHGSLRYPGFQFIETDGTLQIPAAWTQLRHRLQPGNFDDADLLAWAAAPNAWLDGRSPAEEIQHHPHVMTEALATAADRFLPPATETR